jgi:hypothetical protein|tara:strand:+ start:942 stop:1535 length:594 start_codon:yes stop_codon:yes gene_type:complete
METITYLNRLYMNRLLLILALVLSGSLHAQDDTTNTDTIVTDSTTTSDINSTSTTTLKSPPPSAITPTMNISNSDLCTVGVAGAVQTQILGISMGTTTRDMNCEKLKNAKTLYDMGMKVAAVSVMCQDKRVFDAMMMAGTPCPYDGLIGAEAKAGWESLEVNELPESDEEKDKMDDKTKETAYALGGVASLLLLLLL